MALGEEGDAEEGAHAEGEQEVEGHLEHTFVGLEPELMAFGLGVGHCGDGEGGEQEQTCGQNDGPADAGGGVQMEDMVVFGEKRQPVGATQQVAGRQGGDAGIDPDNDDGYTANSLETRRFLHHLLNLPKVFQYVVFIHIN